MEINHVTGVRSDISEMLSKIREVSNKTKLFSETARAAPVHVEPTKSFENILSATKDSVSHVDQMLNETENLRTAYLSGEGNVSMAQVLVASQKSKLAFEGLITVRNKILEAYKEIMNMAI